MGTNLSSHRLPRPSKRTRKELTPSSAGASPFLSPLTSLSRIQLRRIFIRYCMWQEMVLVLFRSSSLLSTAYKDLALSEVEFAGILKANWQGLADHLGV